MQPFYISTKYILRTFTHITHLIGESIESRSHFFSNVKINVFYKPQNTKFSLLDFSFETYRYFAFTFYGNELWPKIVFVF